MSETSIFAGSGLPHARPSAPGGRMRPGVPFVPDSRIGTWFLGTETWSVHVVARAIADLERLIPDRHARYPVALDVGCGWGHSFALLRKRFGCERLLGIDIDAPMLARARATTVERGLAVELLPANCSQLPFDTASIDLVFCHQTIHHLTDQYGALREFHRVLRPGGLLLFAESTKAYIHSWLIRLLFRHPMDVQRSAAEYLEMIRGAGFRVEPTQISYPYLWWSRADLGLMERLFGIPPAAGHEETLINAAVLRP